MVYSTEFQETRLELCMNLHVFLRRKKNRYHNFADGIFLNFTTNISLIDLLADVLGLLLSDET